MKRLLLHFFVIVLLVCVTTLYSNAATYDDLSYSISNGEVTITGYSGSSKAITIPEVINGYPVTCIGSCAFEGSNIDEIILPDTVTSIGDLAFNTCEHLSVVKMGTGITHIGTMAFGVCCELREIVIPDNVVSIDDYAFAWCWNLRKVTIGENLENVGEYAFDGCGANLLVYIKDLNSWLDINFENSSSNPLCNTGKLYVNDKLVEVIDIPDGTSIIKPYAFYGTNFKQVVFPKSITTIKQGAFKFCSEITEIYYKGTPNEWQVVELCENNGSLNSANVYYMKNVTFDSNTTEDVINMPSNAMAYAEYTLPENQVFRSNYLFLGWSKSKSQTKADYAPGDTVSIYSDTTFYAVWGIGDKYSIDKISLLDTSYNTIKTIPNTSFFVEVTITNILSDELATVVIATYDNTGKMIDISFLYANPEIGKTITFGTQIQNNNSNVSEIKAFVVCNLKNFTPISKSLELSKDQR